MTVIFYFTYLLKCVYLIKNGSHCYKALLITYIYTYLYNNCGAHQLQPTVQYSWVIILHPG